ncbi:MAG: hypothetical protein DI629_15415 [Mesorhizobium amorphae]|nr:MAG: hypothetical protein DI629_15415 [Mesorhizobium amorphae]
MTSLPFRAALVALLQIAVLGWMVFERAAILRDGAEVVLKVELVDPRDLFRGEYVTLSYAINTIPADIVADRAQEGVDDEGYRITRRGPITVRLAPGADGNWTPVAAFLGKPPAEAPTGQVDIRGETSRGASLDPGGTVWVSYGLDRFYVPEGEGRPLESRMGEGTFSVVVAVASDGTPQIKALRESGRTLYAEPFF